jgi:hypothetical protein
MHQPDTTEIVDGILSREHPDICPASHAAGAKPSPGTRPLGVIRDRVEPAASPVVSAMPPKAEVVSEHLSVICPV